MHLQDECESEMMEHFARALIGQGECLSELGLREEAMAAHQEVVSRFGDASEGGLMGFGRGGAIRLGS